MAKLLREPRTRHALLVRDGGGSWASNIHELRYLMYPIVMAKNQVADSLISLEHSYVVGRSSATSG